jgi:SPFH domain / Band 7 family
VVAIENVEAAINQIAQTTLRSVVGRHTLDETLSETDTINQNLREILDVQTEEWGIRVTVVELRDIQLPDSMKRAMARQAEAEREKRAKIIAAEGEALAAGELAHVRCDDGPPAGAATQPPDARRDRGRQELHRRVPSSLDEHDPRARRLPESRGRCSGRLPSGTGHASTAERGAPASTAGRRAGQHLTAPTSVRPRA